jgi:hypothetical protein
VSRVGPTSGDEIISSTVVDRTCHNKCISTRYAEPDLNKGESVCIDRCVAKYFEVNKKVGEKLQAVGANAQGGAAPGGSSGSFGGF